MRLFIFILFIIFNYSVSAQTRTKLALGFSLNPTATYGFNSSTSSKLVANKPNQTVSEYVDSIGESERIKLSIGATVWVNYLLNQKWTVQAGLGYSEVGFTIQQNNIQYKDAIFPGVGTSNTILDKSNADRSIDYNYKYQYLTMPVLFNYYTTKAADFKWSYYLTGGVGVNVLLKHQMKAILDNFYIDNEKVFHIDSTGFEGRIVTLNLFLGGRIEYKLDKQITVFGQPMITAFPFSVSKTEQKSFPVGLQINCGVSYTIEKPTNE